MFTDKHYVPAVKWRKGEYQALEVITAAQKQWVTPLVDVAPIPWDYEEDVAAKTIDEHLAKIPEQMVEAWGTDDPIFVDLSLIDEDEVLANGRHPVEDLFERLSADGIQLVPVTGLDRGAAYQAAIGATVRRDHRGVAFRLGAEDLGDQGALNSSLAVLQQQFAITSQDADIILDFRAIEAAQVELLKLLTINALRSLAQLAQYRTVTLLSGAFPINLSNINPGLALLPRSDWALWFGLRAVQAPRYPSFGDYTASHPDQHLYEIDPRFMQVSASIRYALNNEWLIVRGRSTRIPRFGGFAQYQALSRTLVAHPQFAGHGFSWASTYIEQCAANQHVGNSTNWRQVATNWHIVLTAHQIANLP